MHRDLARYPKQPGRDAPEPLHECAGKNSQLSVWEGIRFEMWLGYDKVDFMTIDRHLFEIRGQGGVFMRLLYLSYHGSIAL